MKRKIISFIFILAIFSTAFGQIKKPGPCIPEAARSGYDFAHNNSPCGNQTWNTTTNGTSVLKVKGRIIVPNGVTLTIDGITVEFDYANDQVDNGLGTVQEAKYGRIEVQGGDF